MEDLSFWEIIASEAERTITEAGLQLADLSRRQEQLQRFSVEVQKESSESSRLFSEKLRLLEELTTLGRDNRAVKAYQWQMTARIHAATARITGLYSGLTEQISQQLSQWSAEEASLREQANLAELQRQQCMEKLQSAGESL